MQGEETYLVRRRRWLADGAAVEAVAVLTANSNWSGTTPSVRLLLFQLLESPLGFNYPKLLNFEFSVAVS